MRSILPVLLTAALAAGAAGDERFDTSTIFEKPRPLADQDGKIILTRRAAGVPAVADWNHDGKPDIILGIHKGMSTTQTEILLLENVGEKDKPRFSWPANRKVKVEIKKDAAGKSICTPFQGSCGCKSSGAFEVQVTDWNRDGRPDLIVNTLWKPGVVLLLNTGESKTYPTFRREKKLFHIGSRHGMGSGGGDWNNDGVMDYVFPIYYRNWVVYAGRTGGPDPIDFSKPVLTHKDYKIVGHETRKVWGGENPWFTHTPQAWNYSGKHGADSKITELVAVMDEIGNKKRKKPYEVYVNYYWLDHARKVCTLKATLHTVKARAVRIGIGDLNGDGSMDVLYTGGIHSRGNETHLWVQYGKVKNIPPPAPKAEVTPRADKAKETGR